MPAVPFFAAGFLLWRCLLIFISHLLKAQRTHRKIEELETFLPRKKKSRSLISCKRSKEPKRCGLFHLGMAWFHFIFTSAGRPESPGRLNSNLFFLEKIRFFEKNVYIYIYIHIYERLLSFAGGRLPAPALRNGKMTLSKKNKKLKAEFFRSKVASPARSNSLEQNSSFGAIELKLFLCYSRFCRTAKQPALTSKMCT